MFIDPLVDQILFPTTSHFKHYGAWNLKRYSYTFTTSAAGTYRVGIDPPCAGGNGGRFWGAQLEEGGAPTRYVYTWSNTDSAPSDPLPVNTGSNTFAYVDWPTNLPNRNGIDALMVQHDNDISDYPIANTYWAMIEVEPENFTAFDNRPTSSNISIIMGLILTMVIDIILSQRSTDWTAHEKSCTGSWRVSMGT